ncbi:biopolymer transporter ExbD [Snodgrassella sp. CFCC 13594]|uniref:ExbD/TolR family protein n=1 Tax=Snodgrassella sp. CFCC 13594 TaxID=1775559 RepID=UPI000831EF83|nr:biopolymer transporter ExbD [Snodgrassella sp. CFCC 13594]
MAFGNLNQDDNMPMAEINVTPLVDVMLVLLIVFMITMPVLTHSIPLQLPSAGNTEAVNPKEPLRLSIGQDGQYALGEQKEDLTQLRASLSTIAKTNPDAILAIAADKNVPYDHVAQALAAARDAGLTKVGFVTEDP